VEHACYKFYAFVEPNKLEEGWTRDRIVDEISSRGVPCMQGTCSELYLEKAFDNTAYRPKERLKVARELGETSLMFLVHPTLTEADIAKTCQTIRDVFSMAEKT
jgi:dTDP-4-amino-4,6-dideoxygalactose transaminase